MNTGRIMAALSLMTVTSLTMAGGSSDSTYGEMIRANEKAMQEYAISTGKNPPKVVHYRYGESPRVSWRPFRLSQAATA